MPATVVKRLERVAAKLPRRGVWLGCCVAAVALGACGSSSSSSQQTSTAATAPSTTTTAAAPPASGSGTIDVGDLCSRLSHERAEMLVPHLPTEPSRIAGVGVVSSCAFKRPPNMVVGVGLRAARLEGHTLVSLAAEGDRPLSHLGDEVALCSQSAHKTTAVKWRRDTLMLELTAFNPAGSVPCSAVVAVAREVNDEIQ